jgi:hypothetical protein
MIKKIILIFLIVLLIALMLYYDNKKEYFSDCIIYKYETVLKDEKFYDKGELQLLWSYFKETNDKELILQTYNDKKKKDKLNDTNIVNLDKLSRKDHTEKKIVINKLNPSNTDWATCYFNDKNENVFTDDIQKGNTVFFNRMSEDTSKICENITKLKTDTAINQQEDIILLRIECNSKNIDITNIIKPKTVKINNIRIVKYDKNTRKIENYEDGDDFIKYFFILDPNSLMFLPIKKQVMFYSFKNQFCNNKYELGEKFNCCFNINQLGFESINFLNYNTVFSIDNRDIQDCKLACNNGEELKSFDDLKDIMKNNILNTTKTEYLKCKQKIAANYSIDEDIYNSKNNNCVVPRTYDVNHCRYKDCNYHKKSCDYELDKKEINSYLDVINVDKFDSLDQTKMHYIMDNSEKSYKTCRKYIDYNSDFYKKIELINNDKTLTDKYLSNFDKEDLYTDFNLLEYVSQDNCIYIFIKNIAE